MADQVIALWDAGHPTVLVTSGAVAAGLPTLGLATPPTDLPGVQVAAAVGQSRLMEEYGRRFAERGRVTGQVLLTRDVLAHRAQYLHAREALERMLSLGVVPIVNENDTVTVDELKLGDNDRLAAIVAQLVSASMLVILSDTDGLYTDDPRTRLDVELLSAVRHTDEILDELWQRKGKGVLGSGGVATKVAAARMAAWSGIPTVIAAASSDDAAAVAVSGGEVGTWVEPHESRLSARKLWIAFGLRSQGTITIDAGAVRALVDGGKSLLAVGVLDVAGDFDTGSAVEVLDPNGALVGKGRVAMSSTEAVRSKGEHSSIVGGELIHRDDLVILV
jgi:glutamate 5-kinase